MNYFVSAINGGGLHFVLYTVMQNEKKINNPPFVTYLNEWLGVESNFVGDGNKYSKDYGFYSSHNIDESIEDLDVDRIIHIIPDEGFNGAGFLGRIKRQMVSIDSNWFYRKHTTSDVAFDRIENAMNHPDLLEKVINVTKEYFDESTFINYIIVDSMLEENIRFTKKNIKEKLIELVINNPYPFVDYDCSHLKAEVHKVTYSEFFFELNIPSYLHLFRNQIIRYSDKNIKIGLEYAELFGIQEAIDFFNNAKLKIDNHRNK